MTKKKKKPENLLQLTAKQIEDYFREEWKKIKKDFEKVYRDDLKDIGIPNKEARYQAKKWVKSKSKKLRKRAMKRQKSYFKGEDFTRSHLAQGRGK